MKTEFWDEKYSQAGYLYGKEPNTFLKSYIDGQPAGKILFPGEGEGRNAVYAAKLGWVVEAFDTSSVAVGKALKFAKESNVRIFYTIDDILFYSPKADYFHVVGVSFLHLPRLQRRILSVKMWESLRIGGRMIMEVFSHEQLKFASGGPKDISLLYSEEEILSDFPCFRIESLQTMTIELNEGSGHKGKASVIRFIGVK